MTRFIKILPLLILFVGLLASCSTENPDAVFGGHAEDWVCTHGTEAQQDPSQCTSCHGADYTGSGSVPGCFDCHLGTAPNFSVHPDSWAVTIADHQTFANDNSWTTCAVADCHGADLKGGSNPFCATGPTCFSCHPTPGNHPPANHAMPNVAPTDHGPDAKDSTVGSQLTCRNCHGLPQNNFDGGFVTTAFLGVTVNNGACSAALCHPNSKAHPTDWQGTNDQDPTYRATHRTVDQTTVDRSCTPVP